MVNRLYKLTALIFLLFSGFSASAKGGLYHYYQKNNKQTSVSATPPHHNPFNYEYVVNNVSSQIINIQQHRGAHSLQGFFISSFANTIGIKYLNFICGGGVSELSRFRKLILFPFHDFW